MKDPAQTILAALAEIGPARLGAIADHAGCTAQSLKESLKRLRADGKVVSTGATVARVHALPGQKPHAENAPPQPRGKRKKKKHHAKKRAARAARRHPRVRRVPVAEPVVAITSGRRLVLVRPGEAPITFTAAETIAAADVCFENFDPN